MKKLTAGTVLNRKTSINGLVENIELISKFNKGWLVNRFNNITGDVKPFVYAEKYITNNFS